MKRDMDLARLILLEIEQHPFIGVGFELKLEEYKREEITYHIILLAEAGLIEADDASTLANIEWLPKRLTWQGHEFLDAARDNNRWNQAKATMSKVGGFVFEVGKQVLLELIKSELRKNNILQS